MPRIAHNSVVEIEYIRADEIHRADGEYKGMDENFVEIRGSQSGKREFYPHGSVVRITVLSKPTEERPDVRPDWIY